MDDIAQIDQAIAALEAQRALLGDAVVDTAIAPMREKLDALRAKNDVQRKLVTCLFTDVVSSSGAFGHLDPEDTLEILSGWLDRAGEIVKAHGGYVARLMGDGLLAFFGAQTSREDDAVQAVRSALALCGAAGDYAQLITARWKIDGFNVRVGLNSGQVALGEVGGEAGSEFTAMGDAINMAARMESNAPPGGVLISHETYQLVRGLFEVEPKESILPKGAQEPIPVYVVLREKPYEFRPATRGLEGIATSMVGRDSELLQLQQAYQIAVEDSETQCVTIVGEAGVGKSRLLHEFTDWARQRDDKLLWFKVRATPETIHQPFGGIRSLLADHFAIQKTDSLETVRAKVETGLRPFIPVELLMKAVQFSGALFSDSDFRAHTSVDLIHDTVIRLFTDMAGFQPLLILLEDIHWMDDRTLDWVNRLLTEQPCQRMMIVAPARPVLFDRRPYWGEGHAGHISIDLRPLSGRNSRRLVGEMLAHVDAVPDDLRTLIVENAEGNPFYLEELVRMLIDESVIVPEGEHWRVAPERLDAMRVPTTLLGVLQARLEALPQEERAILQRAAVVGRTFWDRAVERLRLVDGDMPSDPGNLLTALRGRELIFAREHSTFANTNEFTFKHSLLRDATYESVLRRLRREYHRQAAEWMLEACGDRASEHMAEIAHHYEQAGEIDAAIRCLQESGYAAFEIGALAEAQLFYRRALALLGDDTSPLAAAQRANILSVLSEVLWYTGSGVQEVAESALHLSRDIGAKPAMLHALNILAWTSTLDGAFEQSKRYAEESLAISEGEPNTELVVVRANMALGWVAMMQGDSAASASYSGKAMILARQFGEPQLLSQVLVVIGEHEIWYGTYSAAQAFFTEALTLADTLGDSVRMTWALSGLGRAALFHTRIDEARPYLERALANAQKNSEHVQILRLANNLAMLELMQSNAQAARRWLSIGYRERQYTTYEMSWLEFLCAAGWQHMMDGDAVRGAECLGFARFHPSMARYGIGIIENIILPWVGHRLPPDELATAMKRGKGLDLQALLASLDFGAVP